MITLKYTDEATFQDEEVQFSDQHFEVANNLFKSFGNIGNELIVSKDKKKLIFGIQMAKSRLDSEIGKQLYKVTIEKIEES